MAAAPVLRVPWSELVAPAVDKRIAPVQPKRLGRDARAWRRLIAFPFAAIKQALDLQLPRLELARRMGQF